MDGRAGGAETVTHRPAAPKAARTVHTMRWLGFAAVVATAFGAALASCNTVNSHYDASQPHHRPDGFVNSDGSRGGKALSDLLRWRYAAWKNDLPKPPSTYVDGYAGVYGAASGYRTSAHRP